MKKLTLIATAVAFGAALNAAPLFTIGDQVDVFFNGSFIGKWNSNIYYSDNKTDDYIYTFRLGAEANYGRNSKFKASVKFYEDINRYFEETNCNSNLSNVFANASYTEENWFAKFNFSFQQLAQNNETMLLGIIPLNDLVRRNVYTAGLNGGYTFSDKLSADAGFNWAREEYTSYEDRYSDFDQYRVPVSVLYSVTEKIKAGVTYQFRYTEYSGGAAAYANQYGNETTDHFVGLTVNGELLPKLSTELYFGYSIREMNNAESTEDSTFAFSAKFNYQVTDKLSTYVKANRDFANGAARQSTVNTGVSLGASYMFSEFVGSYANLGYYYSEYMASSRNDDNYFAGVGISYTPNRFVSLSLGYSYRDNSSDMAGASYMGHIIDVNVALRY